MNDDDKKFESPDRPDPGPSDPASKEDATELMLVAYLDGELEASERCELESQLESDPVLRRRLEQLRRAWSLLDELESYPPSGRFAETTLEMVALDAESHLMSAKSKQRRAIRRRRNWIGLGLLASLLAGFFLIWFFYPSPDAMLIENLPVIVKLDQYESAESVAFLEALVETKFFPINSKPVSQAAGPTSPLGNQPFADPSKVLPERLPAVPESTELRREWVENLKPVQKAQLLQHLERFEQLSPEERRKLVALHAELEQAKQSKLLSIVMLQYSDWLRRQPSFQRTKLLDLSVSNRIKELRRLRRAALDRRGFHKWLQANRNKWRKGQKDAFVPRTDGRGPGRWSMGRGPGRGLGRGPGGRRWDQELRRFVERIPEKDLAKLKNYLSPETKKGWDKKSTKKRQDWVVRMFKQFSQIFWARGMERSISARTDAVSDEDLAKFFEGLSPAQKDKLLKVPGDQLRQSLIELYQRDPSRRTRSGNRPNGRQGPPGRGGNRHRNRPPERKDKESPEQ